MCGIVGYVGHGDAVSFLTPALKRLEYRGYDSAGVATLNGHGLEICRRVGKIANLERAVEDARPQGHVGIGHTRWATHGRPSETNAHPHVDCTGRVAVVHNGIIENHRQLRAQLIAEGHRFTSETDTEVFAHLVEREMPHGLPEAVRRSALLVQGAFAVACIAEDAPGMIVALRGGSSPLVVGYGEDEAYLASDIPALLDRTDQTVILTEGEMAVLTSRDVAISRLDGRRIERARTRISGSRDAIERGGYPHFMLKEIFEQPAAVRETLLERTDASAGAILLPELGLDDRALRAIQRVSFIACGTSFHAALIGKYLVEQCAGIPAEAEIASELRHRSAVFGPNVLAVPISQSGETADTLAAVRLALRDGARTVAICNRVGSSITRDVDGVIYTRAGLEIGVAATKSFTTQLVAVSLLALRLGLARQSMSGRTVRNAIRAFNELPAMLADLLGGSDAIRRIAERVAASTSCLYLGRGLQYPLALEGALKLKEVSYLHAEGYAAGEMKHGPIALIDPSLPVVVLAPSGPTLAHMASNIQEVKARDGVVIALATEGDDTIGALADAVMPIPAASAGMVPLLLSIPLQLFAYHLADFRGCDIDQPRNLAKSVTVE
jgi:glutamine---fructose-6-phosphate transaminase (isomerizing)